MTKQFCVHGHDTIVLGGRNKWGQCKACNRLRAKEYKQGPRMRAAYHKDYSLRRLYGTTLAEFNSLLDGQGGGCAICGCKEPPGKGFCLDHDHGTGRVRGVLCWRCNVGIEKFGDDPFTVIQAANYLTNFHKERLTLVS